MTQREEVVERERRDRERSRSRAFAIERIPFRRPGAALIYQVLSANRLVRFEVRFILVRHVVSMRVSSTLCTNSGSCEVSDCTASIVVSVCTTLYWSVPLWTFMTKYHDFPLRVCRISGSRDLVEYFVEVGALIRVASTIVPLVRNRSWLANRSRTRRRQLMGF